MAVGLWMFAAAVRKQVQPFDTLTQRTLGDSPVVEAVPCSKAAVSNRLAGTNARRCHARGTLPAVAVRVAGVVRPGNARRCGAPAAVEAKAVLRDTGFEAGEATGAISIVDPPFGAVGVRCVVAGRNHALRTRPAVQRQQRQQQVRV
jgi:hypothetical protein